MAGYSWITLTTDYGRSDGFVAACHGVIARLAPGIRTIDVSHEIHPGDVRRGAALLAQTVPYLPAAVHVAVVDPGVGTARRAVGLATPAGILVGPDNGLLLWAADALGGVTAATELTNRDWHAAEVSRTFHGRDIFAPVAARLADGSRLEDAGEPVDPETLSRLADPVVVSGEGWLEAEVLTVDRFGNIQLAATADLLSDWAGSLTANGEPAVLGATFADAPPGGLVVLIDSTGLVAVAVNGGRASIVLAVVPGDVVRLTTRGAGDSTSGRVLFSRQ